jgi:protein HOOK3
METEYAELLRHRNALDVERNVLKEKVQGAESQKSRDMERIQYLEERVREMETGVIPQGSEHANGDLNSELTFSTKTKSDL